MWPQCEENVSLNKDAYYHTKIVPNKVFFSTFQAVFVLVVLSVAAIQASPVPEAKAEAQRNQRQAPAVAVPVVRNLCHTLSNQF